MLNVGVIGCGVVAQFHLRALAKLKTVKIGAVCDIEGELARNAARTYSVPKFTEDANDVLSDPNIHAVILALPAFARTALAISAFRSGKHVLTEKPVAMNATEVKAMIDVQGDRVGAVCSSRYRYFKSAIAAHEFLRSGGLGAYRSISCRAVNPAVVRQSGHLASRWISNIFKHHGAKSLSNNQNMHRKPAAWRLKKNLNGGGVFVNWGSYDLDYLLGLLDFSLTPEFVFARTWPIGMPFRSFAAPESDAETHVVAMITFAEGCTLTYERAEFSTLPPDNRWQITGERGTLTLQMLKAKNANIVLTEPDPAEGTRRRVIWSGDESGGYLEYDFVVEDFTRCILEKRRPKTSLQDALMFARIADAVYESASLNSPVRVR